MNRNPDFLGILLALGLAVPLMGATCESLRALSLPHTTITLSESVTAGGFALPAGRGGGTASLPAFCRVSAARVNDCETLL